MAREHLHSAPWRPPVGTLPPVSSERALIRDVVGRRPGAEAEFLARYRGLIEGLAAGRFGLPRDEVMEVAQEIIVLLWRDDFKALRAWRGEGRFTTYLTVIVSRHCLARRKRRSVEGDGRSREPIETDLVAEPAGEDDAMAAERAAAVRSTLAGLSPRDRLLLALRYRDERSPAEIAPLLRLRSGACRKAIHDAGKRLRRALERSYPDLFAEPEPRGPES